MSKVFRIFLLIIGTLSTALGLLGIVLPVLPTTPFLLLAAYCYARSSERFYQWLLANRWLGEYIRNYREGRGIARREKILTLAVLWSTIGSTAVFAVSPWWGRLILLGIASGVTVYLLRLKTCSAPVHRRPSEELHPEEKLGLDAE